MSDAQYTYSAVKADDQWQKMVGPGDPVWAVSDGTDQVPAGSEAEARELAECLNDGIESREDFEEVVQSAHELAAIFELMQGLKIG